MPHDPDNQCEECAKIVIDANIAKGAIGAARAALEVHPHAWRDADHAVKQAARARLRDDLLKSERYKREFAGIETANPAPSAGLPNGIPGMRVGLRALAGNLEGIAEFVFANPGEIAAHPLFAEVAGWLCEVCWWWEDEFARPLWHAYNPYGS